MTNTYWLERTDLLLGEEKLQKLKNAHVLVVGLGGVGAYAAEQICRAGVGQMTIVDGDNINPSNKNRQLPALTSTIGKSKASVMGQRLLDINPELKLTIIDEFIRDDRMKEILSEKYDYVVDAIDTLSPKVFLIYLSLQNNLRIVSSMGAGGRFNPELVKVADISKSFNCNLARKIRKKLHKLGIRKGIKVVFSSELISDEAVMLIDNEENKKSTVGTISYMPPIFGCYCASVVIQGLIEGESKSE